MLQNEVKIDDGVHPLEHFKTCMEQEEIYYDKRIHSLLAIIFKNPDQQVPGIVASPVDDPA